MNLLQEMHKDRSFDHQLIEQIKDVCFSTLLSDNFQLQKDTVSLLIGFFDTDPDYLIESFDTEKFDSHGFLMYFLELVKTKKVGKEYFEKLNESSPSDSIYIDIVDAATIYDNLEDFFNEAFAIMFKKFSSKDKMFLTQGNCAPRVHRADWRLGILQLFLLRVNHNSFECQENFEGCPSITSVVIPSSIESIGDDAFPRFCRVVYL